jgi:N-acetylglucosamine kinase-like BadF-type ATPase
MKKFYLGIDVGSTKCHAIIADESGRAVGFGKGGAGNWETVGWENTRQVLHEILDLALESGGVSREQIAGAGFGVAGFDWEEDRAPRGRDQNGREGRVTGSGIPFGEYGGAYEIVWKSIQAVAAAWTRRGPPTKLIDRFIEHSGAADIEDLISGIVRGRYEFSSAQAPQVFELAEAGDEVAREIIRWAGQQLADLALGVARQLDFLDIVFEIVLAGSLFKGSPLLTDALKEEVLAVAPRAIFTRLKEPPVVGGVLLGMEQAGVDFTGLRGRLLETTSVLVQKQSGDG